MLRVSHSHLATAWNVSRETFQAQFEYPLRSYSPCDIRNFHPASEFELFCLKLIKGTFAECFQFMM